MKSKIPGRVELICTRCQTPFKTHSTNRVVCHKCVPKCGEIHYFPMQDAARKKEKLQK